MRLHAARGGARIGVWRGGGLINGLLRNRTLRLIAVMHALVLVSSPLPLHQPDGTLHTLSRGRLPMPDSGCRHGLSCSCLLHCSFRGACLELNLVSCKYVPVGTEALVLRVGRFKCCFFRSVFAGHSHESRKLCAFHMP